MTDHTNQRRFTRVPFDTDTLLTSDGHCWKCHLLDISIKGALVGAPKDADFRLGQNVQLEVNLDHSGISIVMNTTVAHITANHLGLQCVSIDAESIGHLRRLVELNLGDADLVDRELMHLGDGV